MEAVAPHTGALWRLTGVMGGSFMGVSFLATRPQAARCSTAGQRARARAPASSSMGGGGASADEALPLLNAMGKPPGLG
jgi:hypothetical protein